jgi:peptide/nickel transport system permease protein
MHYIRIALRDKKFMFIFAVTVLFVLVTVFAGAVAPHDPLAQDYDAMLQAPSAVYPFGTDQVGRCLLSRILYGGKSSLLIAIAVTGLMAVIGTIIGMISGFTGGIVDTVLMRITDMLLAFPHIVFVIAIVSVLGTGTINLIIAMTLISWTMYARVSRSMVMTIRNEDYVEQARLGGASRPAIMFRYIMPNVIPYLIVLITQDIGSNLLTLASLSLLGLGSQPPTPEWGFMLSEGKRYMQTAPWMILFPGMAILVSVIIFNLMGDSLRDILDPRGITRQDDLPYKKRFSKHN